MGPTKPIATAWAFSDLYVVVLGGAVVGRGDVVQINLTPTPENQRVVTGISQITNHLEAGGVSVAVHLQGTNTTYNAKQLTRVFPES